MSKHFFEILSFYYTRESRLMNCHSSYYKMQKKTEHLLLLFRVFAGRIVLMCLRELKKLRKSDPPKSQKVLMKFHA